MRAAIRTALAALLLAIAMPGIDVSADELTDRLIASLHERSAGPEGQDYRAKVRRDQTRRIARFERRIRLAALRYELSAVRRWQARVRRALRD